MFVEMMPSKLGMSAVCLLFCQLLDAISDILKLNFSLGANMWDYQACTEMVMPMCFDNENDMFEKAAWNFTAFREDCKARWKVEPRPHMADTIYGAKKLYAASNIIFR